MRDGLRGAELPRDLLPGDLLRVTAGQVEHVNRQQRLAQAGGLRAARQLIGAGTPRGLQARLGVLCALIAAVVDLRHHPWPVLTTPATSPVIGGRYTNESLPVAALA